MNPEDEGFCLVCRASLPGGSSTPAQPGPHGGAKCPNGHPIDPSWTSCPYCTRAIPQPPAGSRQNTLIEEGPPGASSGASLPTRLEDGPPSVASASGGLAGAGGARQTHLEGETPPPPPASVSGARATRLETDGPGVTQRLPPPPGSGVRATRLEESLPTTGRQTVLDSTSQPTVLTPAPPRPGMALRPLSVAGADTRELVAVLAAPKLGHGGGVFAVRAGKNTIGAAPGSDVQLSLDGQVSGEHALLLFRGGSFYLSDRMSTNGTWINDQEVDPTNPAVRIKDRDHIRCGQTEMVFLSLTTQPDDETITE